MCELIKKSSQNFNRWVDPGPLLVSNSSCLSHVSVCPEPSDLLILCSLFFPLVCEFLVRAGDEWWTHRKALSALPPSELGTPSFSGGPPHSYFESSLSSEHATDLWTHPRWPVSTSRERTLPPRPPLLIDAGSRWLGVPTEEAPWGKTFVFLPHHLHLSFL